jgi:predicted ATPase
MIMTGFDAGIACHFQDARMLWALGYPDAAMQRLDQAMRLARTAGHPLMILFTTVFVAWVRQLRQEPDQVLTLTTDALRLVDQYGFPHLAAWLSGFHGWALAHRGHEMEGERMLRESIGLADAIGVSLMRPNFMALLAETLELQGRRSDALAVLGDASRVAERSGEHFYSSDLHRLTGELLHKHGASAAQVDESLRRALAVAQHQKARSVELRAATSLAAFLVDQQRPADARAVLNPTVEWFTEGLDTPDYRSAAALLAAVNAKC